MAKQTVSPRSSVLSLDTNALPATPTMPAAPLPRTSKGGSPAPDAVAAPPLRESQRRITQATVRLSSEDLAALESDLGHDASGQMCALLLLPLCPAHGHVQSQRISRPDAERAGQAREGCFLLCPG